MSAWEKVPFADLISESRDGEWGEGEPKIGYQLCEIIRGTDFANLNNQNIELPRRWIPDHLVARKKLQIGDIVFEMAGGTAKQSTGRSAILSESFFEKHNEYPILCASFCRHLRLNSGRFSPQFIFFVLQALYAAGYMGVYNIQHTGVSRFQYTSFKKMTVLDVPTLTNQRKIAAILSAYDDLIENNQRRIALLEKMAEELYREWFVRLRFPGYEHVKFENGLPAEWVAKNSSDIFNVLSGGTPKTDVSQFWDGDIPFFTPRDASENFYVQATEKNITDKGLLSCNSQLYCKDTIFITARGTVGKLALALRDMAMNQSCYALQPKRNDDAYFYFLAMRNSITYIKGVANSGVFDNIVVDTFKTVPMLLPPMRLVAEFNLLVKPMFEKIGRLLESQVLLTTTKKKLLPRLISGKLPVDALDIQFPPSMQDPASDQPI